MIVLDISPIGNSFKTLNIWFTIALALFSRYDGPAVPVGPPTSPIKSHQNLI